MANPGHRSHVSGKQGKQRFVARLKDRLVLQAKRLEVKYAAKLEGKRDE